MIATLMRLLPTYWRPILLALAMISCVYGGWHARAVVDAAEMAKELQQAAEQRRRQEEQARLQDATDEAQATQQRQVTDDRTHKAYQKAALPDRQQPVAIGIVRDIDAAADGPSTPR